MVLVTALGGPSLDAHPLDPARPPALIVTVGTAVVVVAAAAPLFVRRARAAARGDRRR